MMGTFNCIYETPCHWCSKWDKECNRKIGCSAINKDENKDKSHINESTKTECNHEWELCSHDLDYSFSIYVCKKCGAKKDVDWQEQIIMKNARGGG